ncbi:MAG: tetratricopeptide repeat protein [Saprospiraceae bacterium]|nr:tetratricopeptide repeat protein [Saprospiraceae bacterium]
MKKVFNFLMIVAVISLLASCKSKEEKAISEITQLQKELFNDSLGVIVMEKANEIVLLYRDFIEKYPEHPNTPKYLFSCADISMNLGNYDLSLEMLNLLISKYHESPKIPSALHLRGFIYEDKLNDLEKAKASYQELIDKFPEHELAENAKGCIKNLGISPEDLIKMWEKQDSLNVDSTEMTENLESVE